VIHVDLHGVGLPPWMDPNELPPIWCYLDVDDPHEQPAPAEPIEPVDDSAALTLAMVDPVELADIRPGPIDWAGIRAHASAVGFPLHDHPADELAARRGDLRGRRRGRGRRRRRYAKGA
jgi:hypothetical protein